VVATADAAPEGATAAAGRRRRAGARGHAAPGAATRAGPASEEARAKPTALAAAGGMRKEWRPVYAQVAVVVAVAEVAAAARQVVPSQRCAGEAEAEAEAEPAAVLRELELAAASGVTGVVEAWGVRAAAVRVVVARAAEPVCRADGGHGAEGPRRW